MALRLVDFGLVILIWMTQLVVYPSFTHFSEENLLAWHEKYTSAVSLIVMPLMLSQVILHGLGIYNDFNWIRLVALLFVGFAWINTFLIAVPLHSKIADGVDVMQQAEQLVRINWYRVVFWTIVSVLGLISSSKSGSYFY